MSTRASIKFVELDKDNKQHFVANIYHHWDGYPSYLGAKLVELCTPEMVNGLVMRPEGRPSLGQTFNGFGCLVASVVSLLKDQPGDVYLYTEDDFGKCGEDFLYTVTKTHDSNVVKITFRGVSSDEWQDVSQYLRDHSELVNGF